MLTKEKSLMREMNWSLDALITLGNIFSLYLIALTILFNLVFPLYLCLYCVYIFVFELQPFRKKTISVFLKSPISLNIYNFSKLNI